ncbi:hypothetical protein [Hyphococcus sp.]|uniref:hypothetical protein n=1 Tax=Hyphococcus sp. TaxID=2038636 RepID=UPI0035C787C1
MKTNTIFAVLGAAALLTACGGGEEAREKKMEAEAAKHGIDADVELDDKGEVESVRVNNGLGATVGSNLDLPDGFPSDVPVNGGWSIISTSATPGQQGGFMVQAMSESSIAAIAETVQRDMAAAGWSETAADNPTPQMSRLGFEKDGRLTNYILMDGGEKTSVQIVTMKKPG